MKGLNPDWCESSCLPTWSVAVARSCVSDTPTPEPNANPMFQFVDTNDWSFRETLRVEDAEVRDGSEGE
jgi:hypothetical protein